MAGIFLVSLAAVPAANAHPICISDSNCVYFPTDCLSPKTPLTTWVSQTCVPDLVVDGLANVGIVTQGVDDVYGRAYELADFVTCEVIGPPFCVL